MKAVFLDRDGTLNEDPGYLNDPAQLHLLPTVGEALSLLKQSGYLLIIVSNQSGVGRGLIKEEVLDQIHEKLDNLLAPWKIKIDCYKLCLHHPDENCVCRKPQPKLILDAAQDFSIDLKCSYMIGDKASDIEAGQTARCKGSILVRTGHGAATATQPEGMKANFIADSLLQAAEWILNQENASC